MIRLKQLLEQISQNADTPKELDSVRVTAPRTTTSPFKLVSNDKIKKIKKRHESWHAENFRAVIAAVDNVLDAWHLQSIYKLPTADANKLVTVEREYERVKRLFNVKPLTGKLVRQHNADAWTLIETPNQLDNIFSSTNWYNSPELNKKFSDAAGNISDLSRNLEHTYREVRGAQWGDMFGNQKL